MGKRLDTRQFDDLLKLRRLAGIVIMAINVTLLFSCNNQEQNIYPKWPCMPVDQNSNAIDVSEMSDISWMTLGENRARTQSVNGPAGLNLVLYAANHTKTDLDNLFDTDITLCLINISNEDMVIRVPEAAGFIVESGDGIQLQIFNETRNRFRTYLFPGAEVERGLRNMSFILLEPGDTYTITLDLQELYVLEHNVLGHLAPGHYRIRAQYENAYSGPEIESTELDGAQINDGGLGIVIVDFDAWLGEITSNSIEITIGNTDGLN